METEGGKIRVTIGTGSQSCLHSCTQCVVRSGISPGPNHYRRSEYFDVCSGKVKKRQTYSFAISTR